jgi:aspartyl-tRNA synthetase
MILIIDDDSAVRSSLSFMLKRAGYEAETPAFDISSDGKEINEEIRLEKKYLDMRRERIQNNLRLRSKVQNFLRKEFLDRDFVEVETPILTNPTPEGARSYIVPSRLWKALSDSTAVSALSGEESLS